MTELAKRVIACKHWRWMPGMRLQNGYILKDEDFPTLGDECGWFPDLTDPATLGCLLALVREAWGDPTACAAPDGLGHVAFQIWGVWTSQSTPLPECVGKGDTEAEALVASLEAAP